MSEQQAKERIQELCDVSRETMDRLQTYADLLEKWNPSINLVSKTTLSEKWQRHFLDSAQVWLHIPSDAKTLVDIGSGAGFAGLVLAIIGMEKKPDLAFTLIESDARKCAFMRNVARTVGLSVEIQTKRIEQVENLTADVLTARALATVSQLLAYGENILSPNGCCLFLKGQGCAIEVAEARESWSFNAKETNSQTHPLGKLLQLTGISRVS
ncbi:MAG: 16S rRNA (guanine(527)-N(7))-methyltransferase RsmG [Amylibacter sp.]